MRDLEKQRARKREWYYRNKEKHKASAQAKRERNRAFLRTLKDKPCMDCGVKYPYYVMQFDHNGADAKLNNVSYFVGYSREHIAKEAAKCDVVCGNCHAERTYKRYASMV